MPIDTNFPTAEEEFDAYQGRKGAARAPAPMNIEFPEALQNSFGETNFQPFERPYEYVKEKQKESAGFLASIGHEYNEFNSAAHALNFAYNKYQDSSSEISSDLEHQNPMQEVPLDNWTPYEAKNFVGYDERYWPYIGNSQSPDELQQRQKEVTRIQKDQEYYKDGSLIGKIIGGVAGAVTDPINLIPMAGALKYSKLSAGIVQNMIRQSPSVLASTVAYTAAIDSTTTGKTMSDFAYDAAINGVAGVFLTGAAAGLGHYANGGALYGARQALHMNYQGIEIKQVVNDKGQIVDMLAKPTPNSSASAMEVTRAQEFLDSHFAKSGLFKIPFIGAGIEKAAKPFSPTLRGLTSPYSTVAAFMNRAADHSIETTGVAATRARPENFESLMTHYHSEGILMGQRIEGYRNVANGVGGDTLVDGAKRLTQRITEGVAYSKEEWGTMVMSYLFTGEASEVSEVNQLGNELKDYYKRILNQYQAAHGLEERDLPVKTAAAYLSRRYDIDSMLTNKQQWMDMATNWFREGDRIIAEANRPLDEALALVKSIKEDIHKGIDVEANRELLRQAKAAHVRERNALKERIRNDEDLQIHLDEQLTMSHQEEKTLREKLKPWKAAKSAHKKKKAELSKTKLELSKAKAKFESGESIIPGAEKKDYSSLKTEIKKLESEVSTLESEANILEKEAYDLHQGLVEQVTSGEITKNMIVKNPETGHFTFKNPSARPKFRPLYSRHEDLADAMMQKDAEAYFTSITGTNPDKLATQMLEGFHGAITGNPLKERSFMIPDKTLLDNKFLSTDISRNASLYALTLGRKTAIAQSLKGFGVSKEGIHGVVDEMTKEYNRRIHTIENQELPKEKKDKLLIKEKKLFDKEKKFVGMVHDVMQGKREGSEGIRNFTNFVRSLTAATRLGNVPIAQLPDIAGNIIKHGPWTFVRDGVAPAIRTMNGRIKSKEGLSYRKNTSTAGLALEGVINSHSDSMWNFATQSQATFGGKVAEGANTMAKIAGNLSGSNLMENVNQALTANIVQSNIIEAMYKFKAGNMTQKEARKFAKYGVDPNEWADRVIASFERSEGTKGIAGGYQSDWSNWADKDARNFMSRTVTKGVRETIIRKGLFDTPLWSNNPVTNFLFTFTGWFFAAFNRYTIPALQRPFDSDLIAGSVAMMALGSLVDPLRQWSRGEEFKMDEDEWFVRALSNVAPFAPIYNIALKMDAMTGDRFMGNMKNDKHKNISLAGELGGASVGLGEIYLNTFKMFASGKYNQKDVKNQMNAIPMLQMWYMNDWKNHFMESLTQGLPRNYKSAPGYGE